MTNRYALSQIQEIRLQKVPQSDLFVCVITYRQVERHFWDGGIHPSWDEIQCGGEHTDAAIEFFNDRKNQQSIGFTFGLGASPFLAMASAEPDEDLEV